MNRLNIMEHQLHRVIKESVEQILNEIGYRGAALTYGANYKARKQKHLGMQVGNNISKEKRSYGLLLSSLNQAINDNFSNLNLLFSQIKMKMEVPVTFRFEDVKFIDNTRFVLGGLLKRGDEVEHHGCIEYNFKHETFYEVRFYGSGNIRRIYPMEIENQIPNNFELYNRFLTFITNYLYSQDDYENNVDAQLNI